MKIFLSIIVLALLILTPKSSYGDAELRANKEVLKKGNFKGFSKLEILGYLTAGCPDHFEPQVLYVGNNLKAVQKVPKGYLISTFRYFPQTGQAGLAFLETSEKLSQDKPFCVWATYAGDFKYNALNGFEQTIPRLKVYKGESPMQGQGGGCYDRRADGK
jgi:hypothetical protein